MDSTAALVAVVALALASLSSRSSAIKCTDDYYINVDHICIDTGNSTGASRAGRMNKSDIIMEVSNSTAGTLVVGFPLTPMKEKYGLDLLVSKNWVTEEECRKLPLRDSFVLHSHHDFDTFKCQVVLEQGGEDCTPSCGSMGQVTFRYVYSGCYLVRVGAGRSAYDQIGPTMISTDYVKDPIWSKADHTFINTQCYDDTSQVRVSVVNRLFAAHPAYIKLLRNINASLETGAACSVTGQEHASCCVQPAQNGTFVCSPQKSGQNVPKQCKWISDDTFECILTDIQPGNYCLTFVPDDKIRCKSNTAWTIVNGTEKHCIFAQKFSCPEKIKRDSVTVLPVDNSRDGMFIALGTVLAIVVAAAIVYLIVRRKLRPERAPINLLAVPAMMESSSARKVLLLYAQDCEPFMQLMVAFRQLLVNVGRCEVLDCFNMELAEEIAQNPVEWMRHRASSPELKVVVVASNSAFAQQRAMSQSITLLYREPLTNSHLFLYGLKEVTYNHLREYTNTFVVRFDDKDLNYLTPYTRYVLPLRLPELLKNLNPSLDVSSLGETKDEQKLRDRHSELMQYKRQNPSYLGQLMTKSEDVVCV